MTDKQLMLASYQQGAQRFIAEKGYAHMNGGQNPFTKHGGPVYFNGGGAAPAQTVVNEMNQTTSQMNVVIENTDNNNDLYVVLFGDNLGFEDPFDSIKDYYGTSPSAGKGLTVKFGKESHAAVKKRAVNKPLIIEGMRYNFGTAEQLANPWEILEKSNNKRVYTDYYPSIYMSATQNSTTIAEDKRFSMLVDGDSGLIFKINKAPASGQKTLVSLAFFTRAILDTTEVLKGNSSISVNTGNNVENSSFH